GSARRRRYALDCGNHGGAFVRRLRPAQPGFGGVDEPPVVGTMARRHGQCDLARPSSVVAFRPGEVAGDQYFRPSGREEGSGSALTGSRWVDRQAGRGRGIGAARVSKRCALRSLTVAARMYTALRRRALLRRGDTQDAEFLDRPLTQQADAGEVVPQGGVEVAPEVFAEHHVFVLLGYLMAELFDCFDLGLIETHCLVRLTRELPLHGQYQGLTGKILNLAHLPLREPAHLLGQTQHAKTHVARLIRQDTFTNLANEGVLAVLGQ